MLKLSTVFLLFVILTQVNGLFWWFNREPDTRIHTLEDHVVVLTSSINLMRIQAENSTKIQNSMIDQINFLSQANDKGNEEIIQLRSKVSIATEKHRKDQKVIQDLKIRNLGLKMERNHEKETRIKIEKMMQDQQKIHGAEKKAFVSLCVLFAAFAFICTFTVIGFASVVLVVSTLTSLHFWNKFNSNLEKERKLIPMKLAEIPDRLTATPERIEVELKPKEPKRRQSFSGFPILQNQIVKDDNKDEIEHLRKRLLEEEIDNKILYQKLEVANSYVAVVQ
jgi:hypothetical protein